MPPVIRLRHFPGLDGDEAVDPSRFETHGQGSMPQETHALVICHSSEQFDILPPIMPANGCIGQWSRLL
jgi:hypothetical protein